MMMNSAKLDGHFVIGNVIVIIGVMQWIFSGVFVIALFLFFEVWHECKEIVPGQIWRSIVETRRDDDGRFQNHHEKL